MIGLMGGVAATADHNLHRVRRAAINPYFSSVNVRRLQPVVEERVECWIGRLRGLRDSGEVVRLIVATSAFSAGECICFWRNMY